MLDKSDYKMYNILTINGPNLKMLGQRQPEIYGNLGLDVLLGIIENVLGEQDYAKTKLDFFQSNSEGALIDRIELAYEQKIQGLVINAGAYTHTSLALADALAWVNIPSVEVHISNVFARKEKIRQYSFLAANVLGVISGFGLTGYGLAVKAILEHLKSVS